MTDQPARRLGGSFYLRRVQEAPPRALAEVMMFLRLSPGDNVDLDQSLALLVLAQDNPGVLEQACAAVLELSPCLANGCQHPRHPGSDCLVAVIDDGTPRPCGCPAAPVVEDVDTQLAGTGLVDDVDLVDVPDPAGRLS